MGVRDILTHGRRRSPGRVLGPSVVLGSIAVVLAAVALWSLFVPTAASDGTPVRVALAFDSASAVLLAGFAVSLGYASYWLSDSPATRRGRWTAVVWTLGGMVGLAGLAVLFQRPLAVVNGSEVGETLLQEFLLAAGGGAIAGVLVGIATIQRDHSMEQLERQRDAQEHMNALLRHNVLNAMQVVLASAESLPDDDASERIERHGKSVVDFVDDVRDVSRSLSAETDLKPVDPTPILENVVADIRRSHPQSDIQTDLTDGVRVHADGHLERAFRQLVENAVVHHDGTPTVEVESVAADDSVVVTVVDDGPGLPVEHRGLHGPSNPRPVSADGGLGLYLVDALVERYGGSLELDVARTGGTIARVRLPRAH